MKIDTFHVSLCHRMCLHEKTSEETRDGTKLLTLKISFEEVVSIIFRREVMELKCLNQNFLVPASITFRTALLAAVFEARLW